MEALRLGALLLRVLGGDLGLERQLAGDEEAFEEVQEAHGALPPPRLQALVAGGLHLGGAPARVDGPQEHGAEHQGGPEGDQPPGVADLAAGHDHEHGQGGGDQPLPAQIHELVVAQAGQGGPHPDVDEQDDQHLDGEPDRPDAVAGDRAARPGRRTTG